MLPLALALARRLIPSLHRVVARKFVKEIRDVCGFERLGATARAAVYAAGRILTI